MGAPVEAQLNVVGSGHARGSSCGTARVRKPWEPPASGVAWISRGTGAATAADRSELQQRISRIIFHEVQGCERSSSSCSGCRQLALCRQQRTVLTAARPRLDQSARWLSAGRDNVNSWSGNHHTHLVTKTWLPDALLRGRPSSRAPRARGAGCPAPPCGH
jgi:hypothetical protein